MKVVGYIRVSTSNQDLERQKALIAQYCERKNYELSEIISDIESGSKSDRAGYIQLLQLVEVDLVVMTEVSRLSREDDTIEALNNVNSLIKRGIGVVFLDNYNEKVLSGTLSLFDIITLSIELKNAAEERKKIVTRMLTGRKHKFETFENMCIGRVPFGYKRIENPDYVMHKTPKSFLVRENDELVSNIFTWCIEGMNLVEISDRANTYNVRKFTKDTIASIIHNPIYKGEWKFSGKIISGDAIVTEEIWNKAQLALKTRRINTVIRGVNFNPLKNILKCPCGRNMTLLRNGKYLEYRCTSKNEKYTCKNGGCNATITIEAIKEAVRLFTTGKSWIKISNAQVNKLQRQIAEIDRQIAANKVRIDQINKNMLTLSRRMANTDNENLLTMWMTQFEEMDNQVKKLENSELPIKKIELEKDISRIVAKVDDVEIISQFVKVATYFSEIPRRGFLVINFINGGECIYLLTGKNFHKLPDTMKFNYETRKVWDKSLKYSLEDGIFEEIINEYDTKTIIAEL